MKTKELELLSDFLHRAMLDTYAGGREPEPDPDNPGHKRFQFQDGNFLYIDSYTGYYQSSGREVVWCQGKPVWYQNYGGGMEIGFRKNSNFAHLTFEFLKEALVAGKRKNFNPRGPDYFKDRHWLYLCSWRGHVSEFSGAENIFYKGVRVFSHKFHGGIIKGK